MSMLRKHRVLWFGSNRSNGNNIIVVEVISTSHCYTYPHLSTKILYPLLHVGTLYVIVLCTFRDVYKCTM